MLLCQVLFDQLCVRQVRLFNSSPLLGVVGQGQVWLPKRKPNDFRQKTARRQDHDEITESGDQLSRNQTKQQNWHNSNQRKFSNAHLASIRGRQDDGSRFTSPPRGRYPHFSDDRVDRISSEFEVATDWKKQGPRNLHFESILFEKSPNSSGNFESYENVSVSVSGDNVPDSVETMSELDLHPFLMDNVRLCGYEQLTPIQKHAIPVALAKRDLMACAQTGSGKTAAFLLPLIDQILRWGQRNPAVAAEMYRDFMKFPFALILAPSRELSRQIFAEATKLCYRTPVRPALLHGGAENYTKQKNALQQGCHLLIGTPGRINDMIEQNVIGMKECKQIVLDEADRMLDMGFQPQIESILNENEMPGPDERQMMMYSATFPKEIKELALTYLNQDFIFLEVGQLGKAVDTITQRIIESSFQRRPQDLLKLLQPTPGSLLEKTLIFTRTKDAASDLTKFLMQHGLQCASLHGDVRQSARERNLQSFRNGEISILIATEVGSRGLDISGVKHVINYELPRNIDDYVHRIGRTGRLGLEGLATSLFAEEEDCYIAKDLVAMLNDTKQNVPIFLKEAAERCPMSKKMKRMRNRRIQNTYGHSQAGHNQRHPSSPQFWKRTQKN